MTRRTQLPDKLFFKIGEVADIVGVKPHALRYWETEFPALRPKKTRGAHRQYSRRDVELAMLIRQLLHDERYTIPGARKRIRDLGRPVRNAKSHCAPSFWACGSSLQSSWRISPKPRARLPRPRHCK